MSKITMDWDNKWIELRNGQYPRNGELIVVRDEKSIYTQILRVTDRFEWYVWDNFACDHFERTGEYAGTRLSFHGITHWKLLHSPY